MQLTDHFSLEECVFSTTAARLGIDNTPGQFELGNIRKTAAFMESVREILGKPIRVHSVFRCPALNEAVGGSISSAHRYGLACDFDSAEFGSPYQIACAIRDHKDELPELDQCILEYGWVHVGLRALAPRGEFLTKKSAHDPYIAGIVA